MMSHLTTTQSTEGEQPNWAGRVVEDENAEEEQEEEELVTGDKAYLADQYALLKRRRPRNLRRRARNSIIKLRNSNSLLV